MSTFLLTPTTFANLLSLKLYQFGRIRNTLNMTAVIEPSCCFHSPFPEPRLKLTRASAPPRKTSTKGISSDGGSMSCSGQPQGTARIYVPAWGPRHVRHAASRGRTPLRHVVQFFLEEISPSGLTACKLKRSCAENVYVLRSVLSSTQNVWGVVSVTLFFFLNRRN